MGRSTSGVLAMCALASMIEGCACCVIAPAPTSMHDGGLDAWFEALLPDTGRDGRHDAGLDSGLDSGLDLGVCPHPGLPGAPCVSGACAIVGGCMPGPGPDPLEVSLDVRAASGSDAVHGGYMIADGASPGSTPDTRFVGSLCLAECDLSVSSSRVCGPCATCSARLTQTPLIASLGGLATVPLTMFPRRNEGICRALCRWRADGVSDECPGMACDPWDGVCVEPCASDVDCTTDAALTYDGELVSWVDPARRRICNRTTNRCEARGHVGALVGDPCASDDDCAPRTGVCLPGGRCAELACVYADGACGTNGVCLGVSATSDQTICVEGCNTPGDCPAGNACSLFVGGVRVGAWRGYCSGMCMTDADCHGDETCADVGQGTAAAHRACVPRCAAIGGVGPAAGCADGEACVEALTRGVGRCAPVDAFCGAPNTRALPSASAACASGWVCDERLAHLVDRPEQIADGHCAPACASDADCTAPATCVTSGLLAGLCRASCANDADCSATEVCEPSLGRCVEAP